MSQIAPMAAAPRIAIVIPCLNEELTIGQVVADFKRALPDAAIYVFDNLSTDRSAEIARAQGALVVKEKRSGKGFVVQSMFRRVQADYLVMVDGDDTYSAAHVQQLLEPLLADEADMVVATRMTDFASGSFRPLHVWGNRLLMGIVNWVFRTHLQDMMSGYRALTGELARSIAVLSEGFEVETEITLRTLEAGFVIQEVPLPYRSRPTGSVSKLRTFKDGWRVLLSILSIARTYRPLPFFGAIAAAFLVVALAAGWVVVLDYIRTLYVHHVPLAVLATGCCIIASLSISIGIILSTVGERVREVLHVILNQRLER